MTAGCFVCGADGRTVTVLTDRGDEPICVDCMADRAHDGLDGYDPQVVCFADRLLAMAEEILAEAAARKEWSTTREDWVAVQQLESAGNSVYSAQCRVLRAEGERVSRSRAAGSPAGGVVLE